MAAQYPAPLPSLGLVLGDPGRLSAGVGSFTIIGQAATLTASSVASSGAAAPLPHLGLVLDSTRAIAAAFGTLQIIGRDATLTYSGYQNSAEYPAPLPHVGLVLAPAGPATVRAGPGVLSINGRNAQCDFEITASAGVLVLNGVSVSFETTGEVVPPGDTPASTEAYSGGYAHLVSTFRERQAKRRKHRDEEIAPTREFVEPIIHAAPGPTAAIARRVTKRMLEEEQALRRVQSAVAVAEARRRLILQQEDELMLM